MVLLLRYFLLLSFSNSCLLITVTSTFPPPKDLQFRNLPPPKGLHQCHFNSPAVAKTFLFLQLEKLLTRYHIVSNAGALWLVAVLRGKNKS